MSKIPFHNFQWLEHEPESRDYPHTIYTHFTVTDQLYCHDYKTRDDNNSTVTLFHPQKSPGSSTVYANVHPANSFICPDSFWQGLNLTTDQLCVLRLSLQLLHLHIGHFDLLCGCNHLCLQLLECLWERVISLCYKRGT